MRRAHFRRCVSRDTTESWLKMARVQFPEDRSSLQDKKECFPQPPTDPRNLLIDSARYIASLEKRLKHLKGRQKPEPSSHDIIDSLAQFRDDQMGRFIDKKENDTVAVFSLGENSIASGSSSYLQRRLYPDRQAINLEELFELLKDDELAITVAEGEEDSPKLSWPNGCETNKN